MGESAIYINNKISKYYDAGLERTQKISDAYIFKMKDDFGSGRLIV